MILDFTSGNGMTHRIADGSGIGSNRSCRIISWNDPKAQTLKNDYPFVGGRTPQSMKWQAVEFANGKVGCYPKGRIFRIS